MSGTALANYVAMIIAIVNTVGSVFIAGDWLAAGGWFLAAIYGGACLVFIADNRLLQNEIALLRVGQVFE